MEFGLGVARPACSLTVAPSVLMLWPSWAASSCSVTRSSLCASCTFACSTVSRVSRDTSLVSACSCAEKSCSPSLTSATCARGRGGGSGGRAAAAARASERAPCPTAKTTRSSSRGKRACCHWADRRPLRGPAHRQYIYICKFGLQAERFRRLHAAKAAHNTPSLLSDPGAPRRAS